MTLTATPIPPDARQPLVDVFGPLNEARVEATDARRLALARALFPTTRPGAALDDDRGAMRLLVAMIVSP
ncbi:MAG: hypothetical protein JOZ99_10325 [Actinobacteria bacterium]|nr:hypothetical protein [Actinomycetota bacterium]